MHEPSGVDETLYCNSMLDQHLPEGPSQIPPHSDQGSSTDLEACMKPSLLFSKGILFEIHEIDSDVFNKTLAEGSCNEFSEMCMSNDLQHSMYYSMIKEAA